MTLTEARQKAEDQAGYLREAIDEYLDDPSDPANLLDFISEFLSELGAYRRRWTEQREAEELAYLENAKP